MNKSFEFLASFDEWVNDCKRDCKINAYPDSVKPENGNFESRTEQAELLNVLTAINTTLEKLAKNGQDGKNSQKAVGGFPKLISDSPCGLNNIDRDDKVGKDDKVNWEDLLLPNPKDLSLLPDGSCLIKITVKLKSPFFSRDDRTFYPTENVLKRHHVFHTPYLSASGLKGLLHWAWTMTEGDKEAGSLIFGKAADDNSAESMQGLLQIWPVYWKGKVGLEVINPQSRTLGTGVSPIKYEVVLPDAEGILCFLLPNRNESVPKLLPQLMKAIYYLLDYGGLSAKNTAGWGQVKFVRGELCFKGCTGTNNAQLNPAEEKKKKEEMEAKQKAMQDEEEKVKKAWDAMMTNGSLKPYNSEVYTKARCMAVGLTETKWRNLKKEPDKLMEELKQRLGTWKDAQAAASQKAPEPKPEPKPTPPLEWKKTATREAFEEEIEKHVQEINTWAK